MLTFTQPDLLKVGFGERVRVAITALQSMQNFGDDMTYNREGTAGAHLCMRRCLGVPRDWIFFVAKSMRFLLDSVWRLLETVTAGISVQKQLAGGS